MEAKKISVATLLMVVCFTATLHAQTFLSAKSAGFAGSDFALSQQWSALVNPAGIAEIKQIQAGVNYQRSYLLKELDRQSFVCVIPAAKYFVSGIGFTQSGYSLYKEQQFSVCLSKDFAGKILFGLAADYKSIKLSEGYGSKSLFAFRAGFQAKLTKDFFIGGVIDNPVRQKITAFNSEKSPMYFKLGMGYSFSEKLLLTIAGIQQSGEKASFHTGLEYSPLERFFLRGGVSGKPLNPSFGFGWKWKSIVTDLGISYHSSLGYSPVISLSYIPLKP